MKRARIAVAAAIALAVVLAGLLFFRASLLDRGPETARVPPPVSGAGPVVEIDLYFTDAAGRRLALERREIQGESVEDRMLRAIEGLIAGPRRENLTPTLPAGTGIRGVYFREGTAYVDLTATAGGGQPGGAWTEVLAVYSMVNTLTANFPEVKFVQILLEGREAETLAGHVDISRPLAGRVQLLAGDWE